VWSKPVPRLTGLKGESSLLMCGHSTQSWLTFPLMDQGGSCRAQALEH